MLFTWHSGESRRDEKRRSSDFFYHAHHTLHAHPRDPSILALKIESKWYHPSPPRILASRASRNRQSLPVVRTADESLHHLPSRTWLKRFCGHVARSLSPCGSHGYNLTTRLSHRILPSNNTPQNKNIIWFFVYEFLWLASDTLPPSYKQSIQSDSQ